MKLCAKIFFPSRLTVALISTVLLAGTVAHGQTVFKYGAEAGLAFSQFPTEKSYIISSRNDKVTETTTPLYNPLIGLTTELTWKKYFQFSAGFQYQTTGQRYHYHRDGNDIGLGKTYRHDTWEDRKSVV